METAGSEQTSSAIMLWAKTRVYVCAYVDQGEDMICGNTCATHVYVSEDVICGNGG